MCLQLQDKIKNGNALLEHISLGFRDKGKAFFTSNAENLFHKLYFYCNYVAFFFPILLLCLNFNSAFSVLRTKMFSVLQWKP